MKGDINKLLNGKCRIVSKKEGALNLSEVEQLRALTPDWQFCANDNILSRIFHFDNYAGTIAFVNSIAVIAEAQDHHPELLITYNRCKACYKTHTVNGVTINDFICAAKIDALHK